VQKGDANDQRRSPAVIPDTSLAGTSGVIDFYSFPGSAASQSIVTRSKNLTSVFRFRIETTAGLPDTVF
jgi:hypothetical protein